ncbi:MAG: hypothetical protein ABIC57_03300 [bacterium]
MSKLLRKILSAAVFPAALMIVSKLAGLSISNWLFNLGWNLETSTGSLFSVRVTYADAASVVISNTYSNFIMILIMLLGTGMTLFQAYFLHESHQNPRVLVKFMDINFIIWLTDSESLFPKMSVWIGFLWVSTLIVITQTIRHVSDPWVATLALLLSVIFTWFAIKDFEREIDTIIPENGKLNS